MIENCVALRLLGFVSVRVSFTRTIQHECFFRSTRMNSYSRFKYIYGWLPNYIREFIIYI